MDGVLERTDCAALATLDVVGTKWSALVGTSTNELWDTDLLPHGTRTRPC